MAAKGGGRKWAKQKHNEKTNKFLHFASLIFFKKKKKKRRSLLHSIFAKCYVRPTFLGLML